MNPHPYPELQALHGASAGHLEAYRQTPLSKLDQRYWNALDRVTKLERKLEAERAKLAGLREQRDTHAAAHPDQLALKLEWELASRKYRDGIRAASAQVQKEAA